MWGCHDWRAGPVPRHRAKTAREVPLSEWDTRGEQRSSRFNLLTYLDGTSDDFFADAWKVMNGEQHRQRCEEQFAPVLHLRQGDNADSAQNSAAHKVRGG